MDKVSVDTILNYLEEKVENKEAQFDSDFWITAAMKLNILLGDEQDGVWDKKQEVAKKKLTIFGKQAKRNVSAATLEIEASDEYTAMKKQEDKVGRIEEFVRIAKKMGDTAAGR